MMIWRDKNKGRASRAINSRRVIGFPSLSARPPFLPQDDLGGVFTLPGASVESALPYAARGERA
jgi:hypothetical protein